MKRDYSLSIIRMISLCMIICCHICQGLNFKIAFTLNLGVQIFLFLSGYLYGLKKEVNDIPKWYIKQYKKIIIPYDIIIVFDLMALYLVFKKTFSIKAIIFVMLGFGAFINPIQNISHTWFITYILLMYLITPFLYKLKKYTNNTKNFILLNIFLCIVLEILYDCKIMSLEPAWIFCYIFGFLFSSYKDKFKFDYFFIISMIIIYLSQILYLDNLIEKKLYFDILSRYYNWGHAIMGIGLFFIFYKLFKKFKNTKNIVLELSDKYSYFIYLTHQIFILFEFSLLKYTNYLPLNILLIFLISITSGIIIYYINKLIKKIIFTR